MKILYSCDLHGRKEHYSDLLALAQQMEAGAVIVGGDMLPHHGPFQRTTMEQEEFIRHYLEQALQDFLSRNSHATFYALLGNMDWQSSLMPLEKLARRGLLKLLPGKKHPVANGFELIGYAHVPPTPFLIKDHERRDLRNDPVPTQRSTPCRSRGQRITVVDLSAYFGGLPSIEEELQELPKPLDCSKTIVVMHSPPYKTRLDLMSHGPVGSKAIRDFITEKQPYAALHGHIHEAPELSGAYLDWLGKTPCINPGQSEEELYAVVFDLEDIAGSIEHTVFGKPRVVRS